MAAHLNRFRSRAQLLAIRKHIDNAEGCLLRLLHPVRTFRPGPVGYLPLSWTRDDGLSGASGLGFGHSLPWHRPRRSCDAQRMESNEVIHGLSFYPRGGSAQVVRYLAAAQRQSGWRPGIVAGSLGRPGDIGHAATFFSELPVVAADFGPAVDAWQQGQDPMTQPVPMHPSYEDRPNAPDRVFAAVSPALAEHQVRSWHRVLGRLQARPAVLHLHHLTPLHDAAERRFSSVPVITHLHGTELLMLEKIVSGEVPPSWTHGTYWLRRLRRTAGRSHHILTLSPDHADRAIAVLQLPEDRVSVIPNGVDTNRFRPILLSTQERLALLRRWLVDDPRGWDTSGRPGTIRYKASDLSAFIDGDATRPVLLFVGRFTAVKRLPLLLRAYARVRARLGPVAPLLIWGGHPGEWEGTHPYNLAGRPGQDGVFFVGWRGHDELPFAFACADLLVAPSVGEAFGAVYLEAMAAGVPVVATRSGGPASFINVDPSMPVGWLVTPDDEDALVEALLQGLTDPNARLSRARAARAFTQQHFSWSAAASAVDHLYAATGLRFDKDRHP
jgi:glycosyltransferase involved in cell wall biosynthesis